MAEKAAQETYKKLEKDTEEQVAARQTSIVNKAQEKASLEQDLGNAKTDLETQTAELQGLSNAARDLEEECSFLMKNFNLRQQAIDEEIDALKQAKTILSESSAKQETGFSEAEAK